MIVELRNLYKNQPFIDQTHGDKKQILTTGFFGLFYSSQMVFLTNILPINPKRIKWHIYQPLIFSVIRH